MSSLPDATQVLVVGGGPAGASTAWHLARAGLDVTLVDRAHFPRAKPCAEYVSPEGARILNAMGALAILEREHSAGLTGMQVHAPSGDVIHGEFVAAHGFRGFRDRGMGVRRETLDTLLVERARAAGVRVAEGAKLEGLLRAPNGHVVGASLRHGSDSRASDVRATLVVGADGLRSTVSHRLGLAHASRWPRRIALVAHYRGVADIGTLGEMHVTREGYIGLAAVGDGLTNVALVVPQRSAGAMKGNAEGFLTAWIAAHPTLAPRFRDAVRETPVRATGPFASRAKRPWAPGALLVGDAADFYDPFTGEGIYAALRGGEIASPFIVDAVDALERHGPRGERDAASALAAYARARHDAFSGKWRVEQLIGTAVGAPWLMNHAARVLGRDRELADLLVGVTGDFVPPSAVLAPRTLLRFLMPFLTSRAATRPAPPPVLHVHRQ